MKLHYFDNDVRAKQTDIKGTNEKCQKQGYSTQHCVLFSITMKANKFVTKKHKKTNRSSTLTKIEDNNTNINQYVSVQSHVICNKETQNDIYTKTITKNERQESKS